MPKEPIEPPVEQCKTTCPYCHKPVTYRWQNGVLSDPHNVLIADWIYHSECWDKFVAENPPSVPWIEEYAEIPEEAWNKLGGPNAS